MPCHIVNSNAWLATQNLEALTPGGLLDNMIWWQKGQDNRVPPKTDSCAPGWCTGALWFCAAAHRCLWWPCAAVQRRCLRHCFFHPTPPCCCKPHPKPVLTGAFGQWSVRLSSEVPMFHRGPAAAPNVPVFTPHVTLLMLQCSSEFCLPETKWMRLPSAMRSVWGIMRCPIICTTGARCHCATPIGAFLKMSQCVLGDIRSMPWPYTCLSTLLICSSPPPATAKVSPKQLYALPVRMLQAYGQLCGG